MSNVHVDYEGVSSVANELKLRAHTLDGIIQKLNNTTVRIGESWQDKQFEDLYWDTWYLMKVMNDFIAQCEEESQRLERIAESAKNIRYSSS